jgi:protein required for attachment to host cells
MANNTWIVAADSSRARVLQVAGRDQLEEIEDLVNPKGRMNDRELTTDAHPRFRGTAGPGSDRQEMPAVEHEVELFTKQIGRFLDKARIDHRYDKLYLVAPPKMLGLIRKELGKEVEKLVREDFDKDLSWLSAQEIERYLSAKGSAPRL